MSFSGMLQNWLEKGGIDNNDCPESLFIPSIDLSGATGIDYNEDLNNMFPIKLNSIMTEIPKVNIPEVKTEVKTDVKTDTVELTQKPTLNGGGTMSQNQKLKESEDKGEGGGVGPNYSPRFEFDRYFLSWLREVKTSFFISSYKTHKVFSIGIVKDGRDNQDKLSLWMTHFNRPMGIHAGKKTIWVSSSGNLWRFDNSGGYEEIDSQLGPFDSQFVPRLAYFSNDIDTHDICTDANDKLYYVSALFCCICIPSVDHSFKVWWKPPWISKIAPEDRCHLNGICARDGEPRYVSAVCMLDSKGAWRENRIGKGIIYDIKEDKVVCEGLTMPHSPRWNNGKLWLLESGSGWFGYVDFDTKQFVKKVWIAGFLRGLSFVGNKYAVIGSSEDRHENTFQGLPLGDELKKNGVSAKCGIFVINLQTFDVIHNLIFYSPTNEFYDVCAVPGVVRPKMNEIGDEKNLREYKIDYGDLPPPN